jgi:MazG family protein
VIGEERSEFDAEAVTRGLEEKMWRRHPHLFANDERPDHETWERTKRRERGVGSGTLRGLPRTMPPLLKAYRLQERAAGVGFDWPDAKGPLLKVKEELAELEGEWGKGNGERLTDELGDVLFAVVNLARKLGIEPSQALERANDKFTRRFEQVEQLAGELGLELGQASLEQLDALWEEVKRG